MTDEEFKMMVTRELGTLNAKQDTILESLKPDGPILERVSKAEGRIDSMEKGAAATIVTMFLGIISFVGIWLWGKITGDK